MCVEMRTCNRVCLGWAAVKMLTIYAREGLLQPSLILIFFRAVIDV